MKPYTYLLIDLACLSMPLALSFLKKWPFYKVFPQFLKANLLVGIPFLIWDELFTEAKIWGFNPDYLTGIYLGNLPLEEILFFFCIPYACVFTYFAVTQLWPSLTLSSTDKPVKIGLLLICTVAFFINPTHLYTSITAASLFAVVLFTLLRNIPLGLIFFGYLLISPFFLLSNGILTGSFLDEPIVWYDDNHNLGKRIFTIPYEDFFYGFLLVGSQCLLLNWFSKKNA